MENATEKPQEGEKQKQMKPKDFLIKQHEKYTFTCVDGVTITGVFYTGHGEWLKIQHAEVKKNLRTRRVFELSLAIDKIIYIEEA